MPQGWQPLNLDNPAVVPSTAKDTPTSVPQQWQPLNLDGAKPSTPTTQQYTSWLGKPVGGDRPGYWDVFRSVMAGVGGSSTSMINQANVISDIIGKDADHPVQQAQALAAKTVKAGLTAAMLLPGAGEVMGGFQAAKGAGLAARLGMSALEGARFGGMWGGLSYLEDPEHYRSPIQPMMNDAMGFAAGNVALHGAGAALSGVWKGMSKWAFVDRGKVMMPEWGDTAARTIEKASPEALRGHVDEAMATNAVVRQATKAGLTKPDGSLDWDAIKDFWHMMPAASAETFETMGNEEKLGLAKTIKYLASSDYAANKPGEIKLFGDTPIEGMAKARQDAANRIMGANPAAGNRGYTAFMNFMGAWGSSLRRWSDGFGNAGKFLSDLFDSTLQHGMSLSGPWVEELKPLLDKLSTREARNLHDVIIKEAIPMSENVRAAATMWESKRLDVARLAGQEGVLVKDGSNWRPFKPIEGGYYPRMWSAKSLKELSPPELQAVFDQYNQGLDPARQAKDIPDLLSRLYRQQDLRSDSGWKLADVVSKNLQRSRTGDLDGYEKDPRIALPIYLMKAAQAISATKHFGPRLEVLDGLLKNIADATSGGHPGFVTNQFANVARKAVGGWHDVAISDMYNIMSRGMILTKLGFPATLKHFPGQFLNNFVQSGAINNINAIAKLLEAGKNTAEGVQLTQLLRRTGVNTRNVLPQLSHTLDEIPGSTLANNLNKASNFYTNLIGLNKGVAIQRNIAAMSGIVDSQAMAEQLLKHAGPGGELAGRAAVAARKLEGLGLDPMAILKRGSILDEEIGRAGLKRAMDTQLMGRYGDLPVAAQGQVGKFFNLFKAASFQQAVFNKNYIWKPFIQYVNSGGKMGDIRPAIRWMVRAGISTPTIGALIYSARQNSGAGQAATSAAAGAVAGPVADTAVDVLGGGIQSPPPPKHANELANFIERLNADGELGLWADLLTNTKSSDEALNVAAGPIATTVGQAGYAGIQAFQNASLNPLFKFALGNTPILGPLGLRRLAKDIPSK